MSGYIFKADPYMPTPENAVKLVHREKLQDDRWYLVACKPSCALCMGRSVIKRAGKDVLTPCPRTTERMDRYEVEQFRQHNLEVSREGEVPVEGETRTSGKEEALETVKGQIQGMEKERDEALVEVKARIKEAQGEVDRADLLLSGHAADVQEMKGAADKKRGQATSASARADQLRAQAAELDKAAVTFTTQAEDIEKDIQALEVSKGALLRAAVERAKEGVTRAEGEQRKVENWWDRRMNPLKKRGDRLTRRMRA